MESLSPFLWRTCTSYNMPVYPGAQCVVANWEVTLISESPEQAQILRCVQDDTLIGGKRERSSRLKDNEFDGAKGVGGVGCCVLRLSFWMRNAGRAAAAVAQPA